MSKAFVLLGHGSKHSNEEFISTLSIIKELASPFSIFSYGFLEHAEPDIPAAVEYAAGKGATEIFAVPALLFDAGHMQRDFPSEINRSSLPSKNIKTYLARHIGIDNRIIGIICERIMQIAGILLSGDAVILVGRGTYDDKANSEGDIIAGLVESRLVQDWPALENKVSFCFLGLAKPDIHEEIQNCITQGSRRIILVPYFLYDGILIQRIKKIAAEYKDRQNIIMGRHIGSDLILAQILLERAMELSGLSNKPIGRQ